jgi:hypothetical protein
MRRHDTIACVKQLHQAITYQPTRQKSLTPVLDKLLISLIPSGESGEILSRI